MPNTVQSHKLQSNSQQQKQPSCAPHKKERLIATRNDWDNLVILF
ncbi:hypothetical protein [Candidatus Arsenophonus nilaparvatae]|nr:hypothetical protein [Candidatus Arsenophonus nilaparvatae]